MKNTIEELRKKELFDMVVRLLNREDQLINSRMTWYLTIQGFIIAAVALIFTGKLENHQNLRTPAIGLLSSLGILISFVVFISVLRARKAKKSTGGKWEKNISKTNKNDSFPDPRGDTSWLSVLTPGQSVPLILIAFWFALIIKAGQSIYFAIGWIATNTILIITLITTPILIGIFRKYLSKQSGGQFNNIQGVVYDLDGTIVDSAHIHEAAWYAAGKKHSVEITPQFIEYQKGRTNEEAAKYLLEPISKVTLLQDFVITKMDYANQHADESHYFEDFTQAYENLCLRGIPVWVCTTSPMQFCLNVYSKFPQLKALSDHTIWREMYQNGKGEGLIQAFKNMNIEPKDGVYVGDSPNDWKAAKEVGCTFICYRNIAIERHWELLSLLP